MIRPRTPRPRTLTRAFEAWFRRHQRPLPWRLRYDPYEVWVSEVMLQQTRMEVVLGYYERFLSLFPTLPSLAAASETEVMAAWSGLGYYRRAKMLRTGAIDVMSRFGGKLPRTVAELQTIAGIGRYTAGAVASIAHGERAPIVDGNVARILARLEGVEAPWHHAELLVNACESPRDFNQALMEVGALVCTPRNPSCLLCPVARHCVERLAGRIAELPAPKPKKPPKAMRIPLYLITDRRGRVLMRRESGPLMNAMFHLPHGDTSLLTGRPLDVIAGALLGTFRHTVTTRRIEFALYAAERPKGVRGREWAWVDPKELADVPHPSYVRKALRFLS